MSRALRKDFFLHTCATCSKLPFHIITLLGIALWSVGQTGLYGEHNTPGILETFLFSSLISAVDPVAVLAVFEEIQVDYQF